MYGCIALHPLPACLGIITVQTMLARFKQAYSMSLQGSAQYEALKEAANLERRVEKAMQARHGRPFNATIRSAQVCIVLAH